MHMQALKQKQQKMSVSFIKVYLFMSGDLKSDISTVKSYWKLKNTRIWLTKAFSRMPWHTFPKLISSVFSFHLCLS